jgi:hypothetical protein
MGLWYETGWSKPAAAIPSSKLNITARTASSPPPPAAAKATVVVAAVGAQWIDLGTTTATTWEQQEESHLTKRQGWEGQQQLLSGG